MFYLLLTLIVENNMYRFSYIFSVTCIRKLYIFRCVRVDSECQLQTINLPTTEAQGQIIFQYVYFFGIGQKVTDYLQFLPLKRRVSFHFITYFLIVLYICSVTIFPNIKYDCILP